MANRILLAIDPGTTGAIAEFHDNSLHSVSTLPMQMKKVTRQRGGESVKGNATTLDVHAFSHMIREAAAAHPGAAMVAVIEQQFARGPERGTGGGANVGNLMRMYGQLEGVLVGRGWSVDVVAPLRWKNHHGLKGQGKDASRLLARQFYPGLAVRNVKDDGLAEAVLIGRWWLDEVA